MRVSVRVWDKAMMRMVLEHVCSLSESFSYVFRLAKGFGCISLVAAWPLYIYIYNYFGGHIYGTFSGSPLFLCSIGVMNIP